MRERCNWVEQSNRVWLSLANKQQQTHIQIQIQKPDRQLYTLGVVLGVALGVALCVALHRTHTLFSSPSGWMGHLYSFFVNCEYPIKLNDIHLHTLCGWYKDKMDKKGSMENRPCIFSVHVCRTSKWLESVCTNSVGIQQDSVTYLLIPSLSSSFSDRANIKVIWGEWDVFNPFSYNMHLFELTWTPLSLFFVFAMLILLSLIWGDAL